jgi:hypothetical protein
MPQNQDFYLYLANKLLDPWEAELLKYVNTYGRMQERFHRVDNLLNQGGAISGGIWASTRI